MRCDLDKGLTVFCEFLKNEPIPVAAIIMGSGWSTADSAFQIRKSLPYDKIPGLGKPSVAGHIGRLHFARAGSNNLLIFEGRRHFYEGEGWMPVKLPVYLCAKANVKYLILTNAAGGIRADLEPGSLMAIEDHINMMGSNPLIGPCNDVWNCRFPDMSRIYDEDLLSIFMQKTAALDIPPRKGVYAALSGPSYETPAEIKALRNIGADAVGMSTVPEAILGKAAGMKIAGISCISNKAAGLGFAPLSHSDVTSTAGMVKDKMISLLHAICSAISP